MAEMKHPYLGTVIDVREDSVKRYTDAGYEPVKAGSSETSKKSTAKRSSSAKSSK